MISQDFIRGALLVGTKSMSTVTKYAVIGLLCVVVVSCTHNVSRDELVGTYSVQNREGRAVLTLRPDMTFRQVITFNEGNSQEASGSWSYDAKFHRVILHNGFVVNENTLSSRGHMDGLPVIKILGRVQLETDPDASIKYVKQSSSAK